MCHASAKHALAWSAIAGMTSECFEAYVMCLVGRVRRGLKPSIYEISLSFDIANFEINRKDSETNHYE